MFNLIFFSSYLEKNVHLLIEGVDELCQDSQKLHNYQRNVARQQQQIDAYKQRRVSNNKNNVPVVLVHTSTGLFFLIMHQVVSVQYNVIYLLRAKLFLYATASFLCCLFIISISGSREWTTQAERRSAFARWGYKQSIPTFTTSTTFRESFIHGTNWNILWPIKAVCFAVVR